uniref:Uncharacterized protein n=1 Tax=Candidatus Kentrum sp. LPFa TaxID=2126335 RepID=A0A450W0B7_9GAMM|nr:MAG: hypothetical protein BECKLPF1236A_GA0070988_100399 [Candidatus Kentron sp. LPFa]VFK26840.1 MAG: hypothetical protein BECKLPF1236C_GA0070990_100399 [Candidatus Kentron sp. LPFa]
MLSINPTSNTRSERLLSGLAHDTEQTGSDILPEAPSRFAAQRGKTTEMDIPEMKDPVIDNPYTLISDLVGIGTGGPPDIARNHKRIYREALSKGKQ